MGRRGACRPRNGSRDAKPSFASRFKTTSTPKLAFQRIANNQFVAKISTNLREKMNRHGLIM
jgi:hypothetical protein